jgi:hypothetical protein
MRMSIKAAFVAAASTALLVPAAAAFAGSATVDDQTSDTYNVVYNDNGSTDYSKSDVTDNVDVDKTVIKYAKRFEMRVHFSELTKKGADFAPSALIKTSAGKKFYMYGSAFNDGSKWQVGGFVFDANAQSGRHLPVAQRGTTCKGFQTDVDWDANVFTVSAPASCIGSPNSVVAHIASWSNSYDANTDTSASYTDNGHNDTHNNKGWTDKIKKG